MRSRHSDPERVTLPHFPASTDNPIMSRFAPTAPFHSQGCDLDL